MPKLIEIPGQGVVEFPDGMSDAQIESAIKANSQTGFAQTGGGAAVGNPKITRANDAKVREGQPTIGERAAAIGGSTLLGGAMGAAAPELLTAAGIGVSAIPGGQPAGIGLLHLGNLARGGRIAGGITGMISGAGSEIAGQGAEVMGAGPVSAELARLGGGLAPEFKNLAVYGVKKALVGTGAADAASTLWAAVKNMGGKAEDLTAQQKQYVEGLIKELRGTSASPDPTKDVYEGLTRGAKVAQARAAADAKGVLSNAEAAAQAEIEAMKSGDVAKIKAGMQNLPGIAQSAAEAATRARTSIGRDADVSDIGTSLRNVVMARQGKQIEERATAYKETEALRNAAVKAKEDQGIYIESLPEYKQLLDSIDKKLLLTKKAQEEATGSQKIGLAPVTESGVEATYKRIYDAVHRKRVPTGEVNEAGNPTYKEFATSFEALDDVRRKLGEVIKGKPDEGYKAISESVAKEYYAKITDIQKKFAGENHAKLLEDYANSSEALKQFRSKTGKRVTAVDRYDPTEFSTDPANLPKQFLKTKQGINDLVELTGDRGVVETAARDFATNQLRDKSEAQVRSWMTANREMLSTFPSLNMSVNTYADSLARAERIQRNVSKATTELQSRTGKLMTEAERRAAGITAEGQAQANKIVAQGDATAAALVGDRFATDRVKNLIEGGSPAQWAMAAPVIKSDPTARNAFLDALKQTVADTAAKSPKTAFTTFETKVLPGLQQSGLVKPAEIEAISAKLKQIQEMKVPEPEKIGMAQRMLMESIGGYTAGLQARSAVGIKREMEKK